MTRQEQHDRRLAIAQRLIAGEHPRDLAAFFSLSVGAVYSASRYASDPRQQRAKRKAIRNAQRTKNTGGKTDSATAAA